MAQSSSVKTGWVVMFIMGIYVVAVGLLWIFNTESLTTAAFAPYAGQSWSDFAGNNSRAAEMIILDARLIGALALAIGLFVTMVAWNAYRKAEKWSWYTALFAGIVGWGGNIAYQITIASSFGVMLGMIGIALFLIAILIPAKAILGGKAGEK